jgi:ligand-binding SRPBCC domain-containing protein
MIARVGTELDAPADEVWALVRRKETLLYVTRGLMGWPDAGAWPEEWREGEEVVGRIRFFHILPGWEHTIRTISVDDHRRELRTEERGGFVRRWDHLLKAEPLSGGRTRYSDEIAIEAGALTPVVWASAHVFYRYRQMRWKGMARLLAGLQVPTGETR